MNVLITEDLYDKDFVKNSCDNFDAFKAKIMEYPVERAAEISGVKAETIREVARLLAAVKPAMLCYTLGITEHTTGKDNVMSTANLQLLLGKYGYAFCRGKSPERPEQRPGRLRYGCLAQCVSRLPESNRSGHEG